MRRMGARVGDPDWGMEAVTLSNLTDRRIEALRNMAVSGTVHERKTATAILERLDVGLSDSEVNEYFTFTFKNDFEYRLFRQTVSMVFNSDSVPLYRKKWSRKLSQILFCTRSKFLEVDLFYSAYKKSLGVEFEITFRAFIQKNDIFPASAECLSRAMSEEDIEALKRANTMKRVAVRKRLEAGSSIAP